MLKLFRHCLRAYKAGPDIEKALDPVFVLIFFTANLFEFVERRYLEHFIRTSKADMPVGCLSGFEKLLRIFKINAKLDRKPMLLFQNRNGTTKSWGLGYHSCKAVLNAL